LSAQGFRQLQPHPEEEIDMTATTTFRTPYDNRVALVKDTIMGRSKLGDKAAHDLAVHVLQALDSIPEKMR
jgi:hypothetical protein